MYNNIKKGNKKAIAQKTPEKSKSESKKGLDLLSLTHIIQIEKYLTVAFLIENVLFLNTIYAKTGTNTFHQQSIYRH